MLLAVAKSQINTNTHEVGKIKKIVVEFKLVK